MICSASIVRGFRTGIRDKVVGFNAHLQVTDLRSVLNGEDRALVWDKGVVEEMEALEGIADVKPYVSQGAILETTEGIKGVVAKSMHPDDPLDFLADRLVSGRLPILTDSAPSDEVLISAAQARALDIALEDRISLYFIRGMDDFSTRRLSVSGIFDTDLSEFDEQFVFMDLRHLQKISGRGLEIQVFIPDSCTDGQRLAEARGFGGEGVLLYRWSDGYEGAGPRDLSSLPAGPLVLTLDDAMGTLSDSLVIQIPEDVCEADSIPIILGGGSHPNYLNGYEVFLESFDQLAASKTAVSNSVGPFLAVRDIVERTPEIFSWLELLDVNIYIIIILMIGVAIINMSSALLILILERARMIGILKALGADDPRIRGIFIRHAGRLIFQGLFWGNVLGLGICLLQQYFPFIHLDPENYYLDTVPIRLDLWDILAIDLGTFIICLVAMVLPSLLVARISPVRAIRFD